MFSFTGLKAEQVDALAEKAHIYLTRDGRISMAALNESNVEVSVVVWARGCHGYCARLQEIEHLRRKTTTDDSTSPRACPRRSRASCKR